MHEQKLGMLKTLHFYSPYASRVLKYILEVSYITCCAFCSSIVVLNGAGTFTIDAFLSCIFTIGIVRTWGIISSLARCHMDG